MAFPPLRLLCALILCCLAFGDEDGAKDLVRQPAPTPSASSGRWALLIGVDTYEDPTIADLQFAGNDARAMAELLVASGAYPEDHVLLLTPDQRDPAARPDRANILRALAWARGLKDADTLLFFFSGHGGSTGASGSTTNVLYPSDAVFQMPADTAISLRRVFEVLEQSDAKRRVMILDACRNRFVEGKAGTAPSWDARRYSLSEGTMVLYGTEPGGYSYEDDQARLGALTRALLEGLGGEADGHLDPADGVVGMNELYAFTVERLQTRTRTSGRVQVPYRGGEWTGADFALVPVSGDPGSYLPRNTGPAFTPEVGWVALEEQAPLRFLALPGGVFQLGSPLGTGEDDERPARSIALSPFYIAETELTRAQWKAGASRNPPVWKGEATADFPVTRVSWCEALRFANRMSEAEAHRGLEPVYEVPEDCEKTGAATWNREARGYRLPTEAEWEYAARAGTDTAWFSGDTTQALCTYDNVRSLDYRDLFPYGNFADCRDGNTGLSAVKQYEASPYGLYDVHGNVTEWVWDGYDAAAYETMHYLDPAGPAFPTADRRRVVRGGSHETHPEQARSGYRRGRRPQEGGDDVGFRLVLDREDAELEVDTSEAAAWTEERKARIATLEETLQWVEIPAGRGFIGSKVSDRQPRSRVRFRQPFEMLATEVTNAQYAILYDWHSPVNRKPAVKINWYRAQAFCRAVGGRLPTEVEWEYAARAGSRDDWPRGYDSKNLWDYEQHYTSDRFVVGEKPPNAWGLHDMLGNVAEWVYDLAVSDAHRRYAEQKQPIIDPPFFHPLDTDSNGNRIYKMGNFGDQPYPSRRFWTSYNAGGGSTVVGFRCARGPEREVWGGG